MIRVERRPHVDRHYLALAHLHIGRDAASLFDPGLPARPWVEPLRRAYLADPARLLLQFLPLCAASTDALLRRLASDPPGPEIRRLVLAALADLGEAHWDATIPPEAKEIAAEMAPLRLALWARAGSMPPQLVLIHSPPLRHHARGMTHEGGRIVATSLGLPVEQVLIQLLHEECHPVSDPTVARTGVARDTRAGTAGHGAHMALERAAVRLQGDVVREAAPHLLGAHIAFCDRHGMR